MVHRTWYRSRILLLYFNDPLSVAGELRTLFSQSEVYGDYLDKFFLKNNRPFISWIQDLDKERFHPAAETLLAESENAGDLAAKEVTKRHIPTKAGADSGLQLMLSIGKLTHLAQMQEDTTVDESMLDGMTKCDPSMLTGVSDVMLASFPRWS